MPVRFPTRHVAFHRSRIMTKLLLPPHEASSAVQHPPWKPLLLVASTQLQTTTHQQRIVRRNFLSPAIGHRLEQMVSRHDELLQHMEESPSESFQHGKELASLAQLVSLHRKQKRLEQEEASLRELLHELMSGGQDDKDLVQECQDELEEIKVKKMRLGKKIQDAILPKDEDDFESDAIVEIRAGTGGDEAALFASELREMYEKTAKAMGWECDVMSESRTDLGGIKESVLSISGRSRGGGYGTQYDVEDEADEDGAALPPNLGPYGFLKYESGVHRVQRVPVNDARIHTSACSVAVLPLQQPSSNTVELLPMSELRIETMRSSGAGGQHVNTTDSAVRITHIPTGITASIQDARSQHKNKDKALKLIAARVRDKQREEQEREASTLRSSLLGGGDRSERIRTYNYPQDRVTDHRCKHSTHGISKLLQGGSDDGLVATFFPFLWDMVRDEQIAAIEQEE